MMRTWLPTTVRSWHECWPFRTRLYCLIVAGRNNDLRTLYSHWTGQIRKSRLGVLLVPDADYDGDLLDVRLPRHPAATVNKGTLKYSLTYRTIKQPLSGDVLEVVTSARSCPDATWDGTAKVVPA